MSEPVDPPTFPSPEHPSFATFVDVLRERAAALPDVTAYTFLVDGGDGGEECLTYRELDRRARIVAMQLAAADVQLGDRVLLLYPPGLEYLAGFFGCLYARATAVPVYPPDPTRPARTLPRLEAIAADAGATCALTTAVIASISAVLLADAPGLRSLRLISTDEPTDAVASEYVLPRVEPEDVAFLQYTSGSTGVPRGVVLSHRNLLHNTAAIAESFGIDRDSIALSWLPPYHDMGLIGGLLTPLRAAMPVVFMSPIAFLQSPLRWLRAISRYRATISGGPNFAFDLCSRKMTPESCRDLDLGPWRVAFSGAEPVRARTIERFSSLFGPCGFRREAFLPCYGLAEATLLVASSALDTPPAIDRIDADGLESAHAIPAGPSTPRTRSLIGCGHEAGGQQVVVVDPQTLEPCAEREVGEIWVAGPSIAARYWGRPEKSSATFDAHLAGRADDSRYMRTGDLGYVREDGELFVVGRLKDLIIIRGANHHPQDVEATVESSHPALRPGCCAAFAAEIDGEEQLVVVQELERRHRPEPRRTGAMGPDDRRTGDRRNADPTIDTQVSELNEAARSRQPGAPEIFTVDVDDVFESILESVASSHGLAVGRIVLIKAGTIPKTSSGKVQRRLCLEEFTSGGLDAIASWSPHESSRASARPDPSTATDDALAPTDVTAWLCRAIAVAAGVDPSQVRPERLLSRYGLDSLRSVELTEAIRSRTGVALPLAVVLGGHTIAQLAALMTRSDAPADGTVETGPSPRPRDANTSSPLSFAQQRLWLLHQLDPASAAFNLHATVRLRGSLSATALVLALQDIQQRHEILRTTFPVVDGQPRSQVHAADLVVARVDLTDLAPDRAHAELARRAAQAQNAPFDLATGPLFRATLLQLAHDDHALFLTLHHAVFDGWSSGVFARELTALYAARVDGVDAPLPSLPFQYADFAAWQREVLSTDALADGLARAGARLAGAPAQLELPTDRARPAVQTVHGARATLGVPTPLVESLKALGRAEGATLFVVLVSAFGALLARQSGQDDVVIGVPTANRHHPGTAGLLGFFVDTLVLRIDANGTPTLRELLRRTRANALEALNDRDVPFDRVLEVLRPARSASFAPVFQVMFNMLNFSRDDLILGDTTVDIATSMPGSKFDMTLYASEQAGGVALELVYNTDLFDHGRMVELLHQYVMLLNRCVDAPDSPAFDASLVTSAARAALPDPHAPLDARFRGTVGDVFARHAAATPSRLAVADPHDRWTYGELAARANQLAHRLRAAGLERGDRVAIQAHRSASLVWAVMGVLEAGCAFVMIDPAYPAQRVIELLGISDARAWIRVAPSEAIVPALEACLARDAIRCRIDLPRLAAAGDLFAEQPTTRVGLSLGADDLAYVAFTSGSTGQPKGVMGRHGPLSHFIPWQCETFGFHEDDRFGMLSGLAHDPLHRDLFTPLQIGASIVAPEPDDLVTPGRIAAWMARERVTIAHLTPALANLITETRGDARLEATRAPDLRYVFLVGEALTRRDVQRIRHLAPTARCVNYYGSTETQRAVGFHLVDDEPMPAERAREVLPLGRGIEDVQLLVVNRAGQLAGIGELGEIHLRSPHLAAGYLGDAVLTAERFVRNPLGDREDDRVYRTGDLGRYMPSGEVEFAGRVDQQVKIRGFRVEPAEIEAVLTRHPDVREAVVVARVDEGGESKRLVAYVVAPDVTDATALSRALRAFLAPWLPEYMIPSNFVQLAALPRTANGKLDRRALPAPASAGPGQGAVPRSRLEERVASIWREVLGLAAIGRDDNFFELGGHSMQAARVHALLLREPGVADLSLRELFLHPTVASLAARLDEPVRPAPSSAHDAARGAQRADAIAQIQLAAARRGRRG